MSRTLKLNIVLPTALVLLGLAAAQSALLRSAAAVSERQFAERVNLALRQTAHRLLAIAGDRNSAIPPVQQVEKNTWLVRLERNFDYDSLPPVLQKAFSNHRIEGEYNVAVVDCEKGELMLGYLFNPLQPDQDVACGGREQTAGCYNLRVTFAGQEERFQQGKNAWALLAVFGFSVLALVGYALFVLLKKKQLTKEKNERAALLDGQPSFSFGQSVLFPVNQKLVTNGVAKDLTYRETKLLQLFCRHANQLLERDLILKSVWEDEGILVGRSVDVFVSRLRKLLKDDDTVKLVSVHGVGYRMEVAV